MSSLPKGTVDIEILCTYRSFTEVVHYMGHKDLGIEVKMASSL